MRHLKPFPNVFIEYKLEYDSPEGPDTLIHDRLTAILKFVRNNKLSKYTISGFKNEQWEVMIKY